MGTNKITQGEWMLNKNKLIIYTRVQFDGCSNEPPLCSIHSGMGIPSEQAEANAKAIANLPNTLKENESLKAINAEILEALKWVEMKSWQKDEWEDMSIINTYVRAAITKATKQ